MRTDNAPHVYPCLLLAAFLTAPAPAVAASSLHDLSQIRDAAAGFLASRHPPGASRVTVDPLDRRLRLPRCAQPLEPFLPPGARDMAATSVGVRCAGPRPWTVYATARVRVYVTVLVAARPLPRGAVLSAADLRALRQDVSTLAQGYETERARVLGRQLRRPLAAGVPIPPRALAPARVIRRGQRVSIVARSGGLEVTAAGRAEADAALGERLRVRSLASGRVVEGTVTAPHRVETDL